MRWHARSAASRKTTVTDCGASDPTSTGDAATLLADFWETVDTVLREMSDPMTTLKVGIASYEEMKARTMALARGKRRVVADEPKVWFTSTESFAKVLSAGNRELLRIIAEKAPGSRDELARITGKTQIEPLAHAADHGRLRPSPPRTRRAGPNHTEGQADTNSGLAISIYQFGW